MTWGKVDDKLHSSVKWRRASRTARGLWTTALSWCSDQENGGMVPADMLRHLDGTKADAASLVKVGLWETTEDGYLFHDWDDHNPDVATVKATRAAKSKGGQFGNHERWHVKRGIKVDECEFCESDNRSDTDRGSESGANPPDPTRPDPTRNSSTRDSGTPRNARGSDEPEARPQPEFQNVQAVLASMGMAESDRREFLIHLRRNKADNPAAVVSRLHRDGKLAARIEEWRLMADVDAEAASRPAKSSRVAAHADLVQQFAAQEAAGNVVPIRQIEGA